MWTVDSCGRNSETVIAGPKNLQCSLINSDMTGMCT